ncbi:MAG: hypothetical protein MHM6MM_000117 [Cercozoa sp. M6MM]
MAGTEQWFDLAKRGAVHQLGELLDKEGGDINARDESNWTALHHACLGGHAALADWLIEHGADVQVRDRHERTPFLYAAVRGQVRMLRQLASAGADVHAKAKRQQTALHLAAAQGHTETVRYLLRVCCLDVNGVTSDDTTAAQRAASAGHCSVVQILVAHGATLRHSSQLWPMLLEQVATRVDLQLAVESGVRAFAQKRQATVEALRRVLWRDGEFLDTSSDCSSMCGLRSRAASTEAPARCMSRDTMGSWPMMARLRGSSLSRSKIRESPRDSPPCLVDDDEEYMSIPFNARFIPDDLVGRICDFIFPQTDHDEAWLEETTEQRRSGGWFGVRGVPLSEQDLSEVETRIRSRTGADLWRVPPGVLDALQERHLLRVREQRSQLMRQQHRQVLAEHGTGLHAWQQPSRGRAATFKALFNRGDRSNN